MISYVQQPFWDLNKGIYCQGDVGFLIVSESVKGYAAGRNKNGIPLGVPCSCSLRILHIS